MTEQSYIMIKPDGVQRGLISETISRFEKEGFYRRGNSMKMMNVEQSFAERHYTDHVGKPFFPALVEYICSRPVVAMVWEGPNVVASGRKMIDATKPHESAPRTPFAGKRNWSGMALAHVACSGTSARADSPLLGMDVQEQFGTSDAPSTYNRTPDKSSGLLCEKSCTVSCILGAHSSD